MFLDMIFPKKVRELDPTAVFRFKKTRAKNPVELVLLELKEANMGFFFDVILQ